MQDIFFAVYRQDGISGRETVFPIVEITAADGSVYHLQYDQLPTVKHRSDGSSFNPNFYLDEHYEGGEEIPINDSNAPFICRVYSGNAPYKIQLEIRETGHEETRTFVLEDKTETIESVRLMTGSGFCGTLVELTQEEWNTFDFTAQPVTEAVTTAAETAAATFETTQTTTASIQQTEPPKPSGNLSAFLPWMIASGVLLAGVIAAAAYFLRTPKQKNPPVSPEPIKPDTDEHPKTQSYGRETKPPQPAQQPQGGAGLSPAQEAAREQEAIDRAAAEATCTLNDQSPFVMDVSVNGRRPLTAEEIVKEVYHGSAKEHNSYSCDAIGDHSTHREHRRTPNNRGREKNHSNAITVLDDQNNNTQAQPERSEPKPPASNALTALDDQNNNTQAQPEPPVQTPEERYTPPVNCAAIAVLEDEPGGIVADDDMIVYAQKPKPEPKPEMCREEKRTIVPSEGDYAYFDFSLFKEELVQSFGSPRGSVFRLHLSENKLEPNPLLNEKVRNKKIQKYRNIAEKFFDITQSGTPVSATVDPSDVNEVIEKGKLVLSEE